MIEEILLRKNFKHVASIIDRDGNTEQLTPGNPNLDDVIKGVAELNKNGIILLRINTGQSPEGITKICNITDFGLYKNNTVIKQPTGDDIENYIPYKSDSWALGEFIIYQKTGKGIPKRFIKSQKLLDTFTGEDEVLKKLLVLDPEKRAFSWEIFPEESNGCSIQ
jgi:serine/threonine protein kinase